MTTNTKDAADEVTFGSKKLPVDHAILWAPADAGTPQPLQHPYPIFLHQTPLRQIVAHVRSEPEKTLLGFLLGELHECPESEIRYAVIDKIIKVGADAPDDKTATLLARLWPSLQGKLRSGSIQLIGWYHSHPDGSLALSREDVGTHMMYFTQPWHAGLVLGAEGGKPAAVWFRASEEGEWQSARLPFYELLAPESIDAGGKKRTFVSWANFKSYRAVAPSAARASRPSVAARPAAQAPGFEPTSMAEESAPAAPRASRTAARPSLASTAPPAEPPTPRRRPSVRVREPEPEPEAAPEPPPRRPSRPSVEEPTPGPARAAPLRSFSAAAAEIRARTGYGAVEPPPPAREKPGVLQRPLVAGVLGAVAVAALVGVGWQTGMVHFGALGARGDGEGQPPVQEAGAPSQEAATPSDEARPAAPPTDPALVAFDAIVDTVETAVATYRQRRSAFSGPADCAALAQALVTVEDYFMTYSISGKPPGLTLDAARQTRDQRLFARVDSVETDFDRSGCPRP